MRALWLLGLMACTDTTEPVEADVDTGTDTELATDGDTDSDSELQICDYWNANDWAVWCGDDNVQRLVLNTSQSGDPECADYYAVGAVTDSDAATVLDLATCDDSCVYQRFQAVMVLYCDTRGEYITYQPGGPGQDGDGDSCPPLIQAMTVAGTGWYETFEDYQLDFPCADNAVPVVDNVEASQLVWVADGGPVVISETVTVEDADDDILFSAKVRFIDGFEPGLDQLFLTIRPLDINGTWDSRTGTFSLTGDASVELYQRAIRGVGFNSTNAASGLKTVEITVNDGGSVSEPVSRTVRVLVVEEEP
jgi:hypothetical protein